MTKKNSFIKTVKTWAASQGLDVGGGQIPGEIYEAYMCARLLRGTTAKNPNLMIYSGNESFPITLVFEVGDSEWPEYRWRDIKLSLEDALTLRGILTKMLPTNGSSLWSINTRQPSTRDGD